MKALGTDQVPADGHWLCEIKYDGYRAIAVLRRGRAELWSRTRKAMTDDYPEIVTELGRIKCRSAVLDGEIVALDAKGRSRFQLLQGRDLAAGQRPVIACYVFDLLQQDGRDLRTRPIEERKAMLAALLNGRSRVVQLSPTFEATPADLLHSARRQGLEGIVAKRPGSPYEAGRRSGAWLKCKVLGEQEMVIGGFTPPQRSREFFGALLVGYFEQGQFMYAGKVGTGFNRQQLRSLHATFLKRVRTGCPFANLPMNHKTRFGTGMAAGEMKKVTWLRPDLVAQIRFAEWTDDGLLRQPVFLGLRRDKPAKEVRREAGPVSA